MTDILFVDRDETIRDKKQGTYPGVREFLTRERGKERGLHIVTNSSIEGRYLVADIEELLDGYFGDEDFGADTYYILPDGTLKRIKDDYATRLSQSSEEKQREYGRRRDDITKRFETHKRSRRKLIKSGMSREDYERIENELQEETNTFYDHWQELIHRETGEPFDKSTMYKNPIRRINKKDILLARKLISPDYESQRTVMIGTYGDSLDLKSDPETPLIWISDEQENGNWEPVTIMLDHLYSDPERKPYEIFDEMYAQVTENTITFGNIAYELRKTKDNVRAIFTPSHLSAPPQADL